MQFFFEIIASLSQVFPQIFGKESEGDEEYAVTEEERGSGSDEEGDGATASNGVYTYLSLLKEVSDLTHLNFEQVWEMNVLEFFSYLVFNREYNRRQMAMVSSRLRP